jgi:hypothetical protein
MLLAAVAELVVEVEGGAVGSVSAPALPTATTNPTNPTAANTTAATLAMPRPVNLRCPRIHCPLSQCRWGMRHGSSPVHQEPANLFTGSSRRGLTE